MTLTERKRAKVELLEMGCPKQFVEEQLDKLEEEELEGNLIFCPKCKSVIISIEGMPYKTIYCCPNCDGYYKIEKMKSECPICGRKRKLIKDGTAYEVCRHCIETCRIVPEVRLAYEIRKRLA